MALEGIILGSTHVGDIVTTLFDYDTAIRTHLAAILMILDLYKIRPAGQAREILLKGMQNFEDELLNAPIEHTLAIASSEIAITLNDERVPKLLFSLGKNFSALRKYKLAIYFYKAALSSAKKIYGKDHSLTQSYQLALAGVEERICVIM